MVEANRYLVNRYVSIDYRLNYHVLNHYRAIGCNLLQLKQIVRIPKPEAMNRYVVTRHGVNHHSLRHSRRLS